MLCKNVLLLFVLILLSITCFYGISNSEFLFLTHLLNVFDSLYLYIFFSVMFSPGRRPLINCTFVWQKPLYKLTYLTLSNILDSSTNMPCKDFTIYFIFDFSGEDYSFSHFCHFLLLCFSKRNAKLYSKTDWHFYCCLLLVCFSEKKILSFLSLLRMCII